MYLVHVIDCVFLSFCVLLNCLGCDTKKYHERRDKLEETHEKKVEALIKRWEDAEKRYKLLKSSDEDQAASAIAGECLFGMFMFLTQAFKPQASLCKFFLLVSLHFVED